MKIIASVHEGEYLCSVSSSELEILSGRRGDSYGRYGVGMQFNIREVFKYLTSALSKQTEIASQARNLRSMADMLEALPQAVVEVKEEENK